MGDFISKLLDQQLLLAVGLLFFILPNAAFIPDIIKAPLAGLATIGALLVVVATILMVWAKFSK